MITSSTLPRVALVRYGAIAEVARFRWTSAESPRRGETVVIRCHRGEMLGTVLEGVIAAHDPGAAGDVESEIVRVATPDDLQTAERLRQKCTAAFPAWLERIDRWNLELQLIDLEQTLDGVKTILYVLCGRGPDSTKLALYAAAEGLGTVEVQPVDSEGLVQLPSGGSGGGCGSGGGGGGCGCEH